LADFFPHLGMGTDSISAGGVGLGPVQKWKSASLARTIRSQSPSQELLFLNAPEGTAIHEPICDNPFMCGRYRLSRRKQLVAEYFGTDSGEYDWNPHYNIAPDSAGSGHPSASERAYPHNVHASPSTWVGTRILYSRA
jgi:hypothetical protein